MRAERLVETKEMSTPTIAAAPAAAASAAPTIVAVAPRAAIPVAQAAAAAAATRAARTSAAANHATNTTASVATSAVAATVASAPASAAAASAAPRVDPAASSPRPSVSSSSDDTAPSSQAGIALPHAPTPSVAAAAAATAAAAASPADSAAAAARPFASSAGNGSGAPAQFPALPVSFHPFVCDVRVLAGLVIPPDATLASLSALPVTPITSQTADVNELRWRLALQSQGSFQLDQRGLQEILQQLIQRGAVQLSEVHWIAHAPKSWTHGAHTQLQLHPGAGAKSRMNQWVRTLPFDKQTWFHFEVKNLNGWARAGDKQVCWNICKCE